MALCVFIRYTLSLLLVCGGLCVRAEHSPLKKFQTWSVQGEFMFSPCPGLACRDKNVTGFGRPRTVTSKRERFGFWITDPASEDHCGGKVYVMQGLTSGELEVYASVKALRSNTIERKIIASDRSVSGNGGVVFNNSYYFFQFLGSPVLQGTLTRLNFLDPSATTKVTRRIPAASGLNMGYAFDELPGVDLAVSETGLYAIYSHTDPPHNMAISKLNPDDLRIEWTQVTTKRMNSFGNCFVICTKLYCIDSFDEEEATTSFVYDFYTEKETGEALSFRNHYGYTVSVNYNPADHKLYAWDRGNLLTHNVHFSK